MKIAWFTDTWLPARDGVVTSLLSFKKVLEKEHEIFIFAPSYENRREGNIFYFRSKPFPKYPDYRISSLKPIFSRKIGKILMENDIDVVHSHSPAIIGTYAVTASRFASIPLIHTYHTFLHESTYLLSQTMQKLTGKLLDMWLEWYFERCKAIVVPSKYMANKFKKYRKKIEIIPTGVDIRKFERSNKERINRGKIALYVGRIVKEKNIDAIINVSPLLKDVKFVIVGEGPYRNELMKKAISMKAKNVIFTGYVSDDELLDYYKSADVFVFPSTYETQGIVALEAMASGLPVVAARAKALPEFVIDGENGYLFSPYDTKDFAEKIEMALQDKNMGKRARKFVEKFDNEKMAEKLVNLYDRVSDEN